MFRVTGIGDSGTLRAEVRPLRPGPRRLRRPSSFTLRRGIPWTIRAVATTVGATTLGWAVVLAAPSPAAAGLGGTDGLPWSHGPLLGPLLGPAGLALAATLVVALLSRPLLPVRLRARWRRGRLTVALQVGWPWLAYRYRLGWHPPGPLQLRRSLRLPPLAPRRRAVLYRRRVMPRLAFPWPLPVPTPAWQFLRVATAGRWRLQRLSLQARTGLADAALTAWLTGALRALAGAAAAAVTTAARGPAREPPDIRIEPVFGRPEWTLDFDCIALVPPWEAMSAARALLGVRRRAGPAGSGPGGAERPGKPSHQDGPSPPRAAGTPAAAQAASPATPGAPAAAFGGPPR